MLKICITGHRDLLNSEDVANDIEYSLKYFREIDNELLAISSVARSADTLFAEKAITQNIPLKLKLPFNLEEYKKDFNETDLEKLEIFLNKYEYEIVNKLATDELDERNNAYLKTGQRNVDTSDIVLAVWDGQPARGKGGTGDIVAYAKSKGKELHIIKGITKLKPSSQVQPDEAQVNFDKFDKAAIKYKKHRFEPAWIAGIIAGLIAVFCFAIGLTFYIPSTLKFILLCCEIFFLVSSFILLAICAKNWKNVFLENRRNAEYLRAVFWYKDAGIPIPKIVETVFKPGIKILDIENKVTSAIKKIENIPNSKRIAWCLAQKQEDYHQNIRIKQFRKKIQKMEKWLKVIKFFFFGVILANFIFESMEYFHNRSGINFSAFKPYFLFSLLVLPPVYAAFEGVKYFSEWKRNIDVSGKTVNELKKIKERILLCNDEISLMNETKELRKILEIENSDWAVRYDEKEVGAKP